MEGEKQSVLNNSTELRVLGDSEEERMAEEFMLQFASDISRSLNAMHGVTMYRELPPNIRMSIFAQGALMGIMTGCIRGFMHGADRTRAEETVREYVTELIEPAIRNFRQIEKEGLIHTEDR